MSNRLSTNTVRRHKARLYRIEGPVQDAIKLNVRKVSDNFKILMDLKGDIGSDTVTGDFNYQFLLVERSTKKETIELIYIMGKMV